MKNFSSRVAVSIVAIAFLLFTAAKPVHADTYQIFDLGSGYRTALTGIEHSGAVVLFAFDGACSFHGSGCWQTWANGMLVGQSNTYPNPVFDNGTACIPVEPAAFGGVFMAAACNNGREVYGTDRYTVAPYQDAIFTGPDPVADYFGPGPLNEVRLNSSGDFVYLAGNLGFGDGEFFEAVRQTTAVSPEPGSIFLLGTGALAVLGTMRRRLSR